MNGAPLAIATASCLLGLAAGIPWPFPAASAQEAVPDVTFTVSEFGIDGENPLSKGDTGEVLSPFLGEHTGLARLLDAATALTQELHAQGHAFHKAVLPPQTLEGGKVTLQIVVATLGEVSVTGQKHFSEANIRRTAPGLEPGKVPDIRRLGRALALANQQPARRVTLALAESKKPLLVDATLEVEDRKPWAVFSAFNNVGTDETGETRISIGAVHSNLFDLDQSLILSYTTSPENVDDVFQFGAQYRIPIYRFGGMIALYYTRSDVETGTISQLGGDFFVSGAGDFAGGSYTQNLYAHGAYRHSAMIAVDDRFFENDVTFAGTPLVDDVRSRPLTIRYDGSYRFDRAVVAFFAAYVGNLPGGAHNTDGAYAQSRSVSATPGARGIPDRDWHAVRYGANLTYSLPRDWEANVLFDGQWSGDVLISGERFGIGGSRSVRGYLERAISGDRGQHGTVEIWTPGLWQGIRALGFLDVGHTALDEPLTGEVRSETIASMGVGVRWQWKQFIDLSVDYGHQVNDATVSQVGGSRWHFNLAARY
jgi:hemolysin activation/secretion protein